MLKRKEKLDDTFYEKLHEIENEYGTLENVLPDNKMLIDLQEYIGLREKGFSWNEKNKKQLVNMRDSGIEINTIAKQMGVLTSEATYELIKQKQEDFIHGMEDYDRLRLLYRQKMQVEDIAKVLDSNVEEVQKKINIYHLSRDVFDNYETRWTDKEKELTKELKKQGWTSGELMYLFGAGKSHIDNLISSLKNN